MAVPWCPVAARQNLPVDGSIAKTHFYHWQQMLRNALCPVIPPCGFANEPWRRVSEWVSQTVSELHLISLWTVFQLKTTCQLDMGGSPELMQVFDVYHFDETHDPGFGYEYWAMSNQCPMILILWASTDCGKYICSKCQWQQMIEVIVKCRVLPAAVSGNWSYLPLFVSELDRLDCWRDLGVGQFLEQLAEPI